ncbi:hypothetical protein SAMN04515666_11944 [Bosea lupini]|uniref:Phage regulatory protein CII (CP76) n=1 Tax=Bosea lupini TaxID=1036779 RepID=A0A1H8AG43_9HYPH|nr:hypothetical protein [Bosea lupini]SEM69581.1 hypothetical protein SAMN04515666_11944 [Bosea lupini]
MSQHDAEFFRIKASHGDLIDRCGGQKRAAGIVGLGQTMMSYVKNREHGALLTVRGKLLLERECGEPLATRVEADLLGYQLERKAGPDGPLPANPFAAVAAISQEYSDLVAGFAQGTLDGDFSRADAARADRDLSDLIARAEAFRKFIAAQLAGGAA